MDMQFLMSDEVHTGEPVFKIHYLIARFNELFAISEGGSKMKKLFFGIMLFTLIFVVPIPTMARVDLNIGISLPPPIVFAAPPELIVIPETYVYVAPDIEVDLFFWNGWWWRLWEGRWYRSHYYNRGWGRYNSVPSFYFDVDPGWRGYYRDRNWYGHRWDYERIPNQRLQQNWKSWQSGRHWEKQGTWGVQSYQPRPQQQRQELRQQRQQQYQQRPEAQKKQPQEKVKQLPREEQRPQVKQPNIQPRVQEPRQEHQEQLRQPQRGEQRPQVEQQERQPRVQEPRQEHQEQVQQPQREEQRPQGEQQQRSQPQGKSERGEGGHKK